MNVSGAVMTFGGGAAVIGAVLFIFTYHDQSANQRHVTSYVIEQQQKATADFDRAWAGKALTPAPTGKELAVLHARTDRLQAEADKEHKATQINMSKLRQSITVESDGTTSGAASGAMGGAK